MRKLFTVIALLATFSFTFSAEWQIVDSIYYKPNKQYGVLSEAIDCYDSLNCIAVLNMNKKWPWNRRTTDGGKTWATTLRDTSYSIYDDLGNLVEKYVPAKVHEVSYPSRDFCIAVCDSGRYWISRDSCKTWTKRQLDTRKPLRKVDFINNKFGGIPTWDGIFITSDGGLTWENVVANLPEEIPNRNFTDIFYFESSTFYILSYDPEIKISRIFRTEDFGKNWTYSLCGEKPTLKMFFLNKTEGWIAGGQQVEPGSAAYRSIIYHTSDAGENCEPQLDTLIDYHRVALRQIYFTDKNNGVALGKYYSLWRTTNGGDDWILDENYKEEVSPYDLWDVAFFNHDHMFGLPEVYPFILKFSGRINSADEAIDGINPAEILRGIVFPNPGKMGESVRFGFDLFESGALDMVLYDLQGNIIDTWTPKFFSRGYYEIAIDLSRGFPVGEYFLQVNFNGSVAVVEKIIVE